MDIEEIFVLYTLIYTYIYIFRTTIYKVKATFIGVLFINYY